MRPQNRILWLLVPAMLLLVTSCSRGSDGNPTKQSSDSASTSVATSAVQTGSTATDGVCVITIPDDWVDDGTGRGETSTGDEWSLFGGTAATDTAWTAARDLLKAQFDGQETATITEAENMVTVTLANGRGLYVRERFDSTYCEFSVTSSKDNPDETLTRWQSVADTLGLPD